jgi:cytochrome P450
VADRRRGSPAAGFTGSDDRSGSQQGHRHCGHRIIIYLAGANRDPKVFTDPHRFDIERDNAGKHLSFSGGRHFCLGAALARQEGEVGLRTFFERFPDARLAGIGSRRDTRVLRGWSSLPIDLGKATAMSSRA